MSILPSANHLAIQTSLRVFTDNVVTLALENCLISDIPNILSPDRFYDMSEETVKALAAESKEIQKERSELQSQLKRLRQTAHKYGTNQSSGMSDSDLKVPRHVPSTGS